MNLTNYEQTETLRALGYPSDDLAWVSNTPTDDGPYIDRTDVHSAIMWLMASERWRKLWGNESYVTTHCNGSATIGVPGAGLLGVTAEGDFPTPAELLDAMLAALKEDSRELPTV